MSTIKASKQGLVQIKKAIARKGWIQSDDRWSLAASKIAEPSRDWEESVTFAYGCSKSTRERLLQGKFIRKKAFRAFCKVLELNPDEVGQEKIKIIKSFNNPKKEIIRQTPIFKSEKLVLVSLKVNHGDVIDAITPIYAVLQTTLYFELSLNYGKNLEG